MSAFVAFGIGALAGFAAQEKVRLDLWKYGNSFYPSKPKAMIKKGPFDIRVSTELRRYLASAV